MADDEKDTLMDALRELSLRAAHDLVRFSQQVREVKDSFDGTPLSGGKGSGMSREPHHRPGELAYEAIKMQLQLASSLLTLGHKQADFWLERAARLGQSMLSPDRRPALRIAAEEGKLLWKVYIHNAARERRTLRLKAGAWRKADGTPTEETPLIGFENADDAEIGGQGEKHVTLKADSAPKGEGKFAVDVEVALDGDITTPLGRLELTVQT